MADDGNWWEWFRAEEQRRKEQTEQRNRAWSAPAWLGSPPSDQGFLGNLGYIARGAGGLLGGGVLTPTKNFLLGEDRPGNATASFANQRLPSYDEEMGAGQWARGAGAGAPTAAAPSVSQGRYDIRSVPRDRNDPNSGVVDMVYERGEPIGVWNSQKGGIDYFDPNMDPTVRAAIIAANAKQAGAGSYPPQFDYSKTEGYTKDVLGNNLEVQRLKNEADREKYAAEGASATLAETIKSGALVEVAKINRDSSLSSDQKAVEIAKINKQSAADVAEASAAASVKIAELEAASKDRQTAAELAAKQGDWASARELMASNERIAAAKASLEKEVEGLRLYGNLVAVESAERGKRAETAANVFGKIADLIEKGRNTGMLYASRGVAPPNPLAAIPSGLFAAMGVNPDTAAATAQGLQGQGSMPPWLSKLIGGPMA